MTWCRWGQGTGGMDYEFDQSDKGSLGFVGADKVKVEGYSWLPDGTPGSPSGNAGSPSKVSTPGSPSHYSRWEGSAPVRKAEGSAPRP